MQQNSAGPHRANIERVDSSIRFNTNMTGGYWISLLADKEHRETLKTIEDINDTASE